MPRKGKLNRRGVGELWDAPKIGVNIPLTRYGREKLSELAASYGLSRPEFVEQIARGLFKVSKVDQQEQPPGEAS